MSMLTACGGGSEETSTDTAAEEVVEEEDTAEDSAADGMCSDETFSALQDNYASMVEAYNAVKDLSETKGKFAIVLYDDGTVNTVQYWNSGWTVTYTDGTYNEATPATAPDSNTTTTITQKS